MQVIIDGLKFSSKEEFHRYIKTLFELQDYYGENLDALWDLLNCMGRVANDCYMV